jgi:hypothetical protein
MCSVEISGAQRWNKVVFIFTLCGSVSSVKMLSW